MKLLKIFGYTDYYFVDDITDITAGSMLNHITIDGFFLGRINKNLPISYENLKRIPKTVEISRHLLLELVDVNVIDTGLPEGMLPAILDTLLS